MIYRITGGIFFLLTAFSLLGITTFPAAITAVFALIAGIALLAGQ